MRVHALQDTGKPFGFLLVTAPRTYRIFGSSKPEQQEWMTAIKTAKADFNKRKVEAARRAEVCVPPCLARPLASTLSLTARPRARRGGHTRRASQRTCGCRTTKSRASSWTGSFRSSTTGALTQPNSLPGSSPAHSPA